jgi:predicted DNA-binding transcriptional regulator AlpA
MATNPDELLTPREVALLLKVHVATLEGWRNMKTGPKYLKLGDGSRAPVRYRRGDIETYLAGQAK